MKMSKLFSIKLFVIALICFISLSNIKEETRQTKHTVSDVQSVTVTHFHFDSIVSYFDLYTLVVSQPVMNIIKVIVYFDNQNETKLITNISNLISHDIRKLDTS